MVGAVIKETRSPLPQNLHLGIGGGKVTKKIMENMSTNWDRGLKERPKELFERHRSTALVE